ncbi:MAG: hypothetical protein N2595_07385 [bacterium]|nr:hypothetical protein [bacterium]
MKTLVTILIVLALTCTGARGVTIAFWSFNSATPMSPDEGAGTLVDATGAGLSTFVAGVSYGAYTAGSAISRATPNWASGSQSTRFYEIRVNASSLVALSLRYDGNRSGTGPTRVDLYYSTDGGSSYAFHSSVTQPSSWTAFSFPGLSSISGLNNNSDVRFRLCPMSASGTAGTIRFDNILVEGLPEPAVLGLVAAGLLLLAPRAR